MEIKMEPRIVCAANMLEDGTVIVGVRHFDHLMHNQIENYLKANGMKNINSSTTIQGFVDQLGTFYDREEAYVIAKRANQIIRDHDKVGKLFSEHLY